MNTIDNYIKKWEAALEEYDAKAERLDAQERLRYNDWRHDMKEKFNAISDWTESAWDEFIAKAEQKWHDMVISRAEDKADNET